MSIKDELLKEVGPSKRKFYIYMFLVSLIFISLFIPGEVKVPIYPILAIFLFLIYTVVEQNWRACNYEFYLKYGKNYKREMYVHIYGTEKEMLALQDKCRKAFIPILAVSIFLPTIYISFLWLTLFLIGGFLVVFWHSLSIPKEIRGT